MMDIATTNTNIKRTFEEALSFSSPTEYSPDNQELESTSRLFDESVTNKLKHMRIDRSFNYSGNFQGKLTLTGDSTTPTLSLTEPTESDTNHTECITNTEYLHINAYLKQVHLEACRRRGGEGGGDPF